MISARLPGAAVRISASPRATIRTDEDVFAAFDLEASSVHVGFDETRARFRVPDVVRLLLSQFVKVEK